MKNVDFVAVDLGAASGRVICASWGDGTGFVLHEIHRFPNTPIMINSHLHWDFEQLWQEIMVGLQRYAAQTQNPLISLGVDTWGVDFGLLDATGQLLGPPYSYRDLRTEHTLTEMSRMAEQTWIFNQTGIQFMRINTLNQLWAMVRDHDPHLQRAETLLLMPDLFHYRLTGVKATEYSNATTTQCFDPRRNTWAHELLGKFGIPTRIFPSIVAPGTTLGPLLPAVASASGLPATTLVVAPATHDTGSAVAAIPGLDAHSAYISSGTWSLVGVELPAPLINADTLRLNFTNEGGVAGTTRLLRNVMGLWLVQECQRCWNNAGQSYRWDELQRAAEQAPALQSLIDPDAPELLSPSDMPTTIQRLCQQKGQPQPEHVGAIVRCCFESLAFRYRWVIEALEIITGRRISTIRVVGGGSQNALLCQLTANLCERTVVAGPAEATALGNVLVQAISAGFMPDIATGREIIASTITQTTYLPQPVAQLGSAYQRWRSLLG
jgi:rhamnulokinase